MRISLNSIQAKSLADFFFDIAKGLVLSGIGFAAIVPIRLKLTIGLLNIILSFGCIRLALVLLEDVK